MDFEAPEHFSEDTYDFLAALKAHNDREWFAEHKPRYERSVREPARAFIRAMGTMFPSISRQFVVSDRKQGGSLMRIHRDVRFSKDKSPYKTNIGIHFRHVDGKDVHAPGFYVHVSPQESFLGVGIYGPPNDALNAIRRHIDRDHGAWLALRDGLVGEGFEFGGASLKRAPRGFPKDHALLEDLKRKSFIVSTPLAKADALSESMPDKVFQCFQAGAPLASFICEALGLRF